MTARKSSFLIFILLCCGIFCTLGAWQVKRLHWKEGLIQALDRAYETQEPLTADIIRNFKPGQFFFGQFEGTADFSKAFELSGQIDGGRQTTHVMIPFALEQNATVLIDMGPDFTPPEKSGTASITGLLRYAPQPNSFTPDNVPEKNTWYSVDPQALGIPGLKPLVIMPETTPWKNFDRKKPELRNSHLQYAIFWFTAAFIMLALTGYYLRR